MRDHLNHRQRRFVRFYLLLDQATKAAVKAGYSPNTARVQGSRLLKNPKIAAELMRRGRLVANRQTDRDTLEVGEDGLPRRDRAPPMSGRLNHRHREFIRFYVRHGQITKAAIEAGYAPTSAHVQGSRLLKNPKVAAEIERRRRLVACRELERDAITAAAIEKELANIAFANLDDYLKIGKDGVPRLDLADLTPRQRAALAKIAVTTRTIKRDGRLVQVHRLRLKLHNKSAALVRLGKLKGLFEWR